MDEQLHLPITYKGQELEFPFKIVASGFVRRFVVSVDGLDVVVEKDDAGEYRALIYDADTLSIKLPERGLLEAITSVIQQLTS